MTIRHLKTFCAVCEEGGITRAAEKLCVAQPSVSQTISELERYYGVSLFDRSGSLIQCNVDLTKASSLYKRNTLSRTSSSSESSSASIVRPNERRQNYSVTTRDFHRMSAVFPGSLPSKHGFFNSMMQTPLSENVAQKTFLVDKHSHKISRASSHGQDLLDINELDSDDFTVVNRHIKHFEDYKVKKGPLSTIVMRNSNFGLISQEKAASSSSTRTQLRSKSSLFCTTTQCALH